MQREHVDLTVVDPTKVYRYRLSDEATRRLWAGHIERRGLTATIELPDRTEVWIGGAYLGREPSGQPARMPLLGRLLVLPLLRFAIRRGWLGLHTGAACSRFLDG